MAESMRYETFVVSVRDSTRSHKYTQQGVNLLSSATTGKAAETGSRVQAGMGSLNGPIYQAEAGVRKARRSGVDCRLGSNSHLGQVESVLSPNPQHQAIIFKFAFPPLLAGKPRSRGLLSCLAPSEAQPSRNELGSLIKGCP